MAYRWPKASHYASAIFIGALQGGRWMFEQWASQTEWWREIPFGWLTITVIAFWAGLCVQDLYNQRSWLRHNWRELRRAFHAHTISRAKNDDQKQWFELTAVVRFTRRINATVELFAYDAVQFELFNKPKLIYRINKLKYSKDETLDLTMACIPHYIKQTEPRRHSLWGTEPGENHLREGAQTIHPSSDNLAEIRISSWLGIQTYRVFFAMTENRTETGGAFFFLPEDRDVSFR